MVTPVSASVVVPQGNPTGLVLPSSSAIQDNFLNSYTPSPSDTRFMVDLYHALQNHLPLTHFQETFIVLAGLFPLPFSWKLKFFSWLYDLPQSNFMFNTLVVVIVLLLCLGLFYLLRYLVHSSFSKNAKLVFLELTFPALTNKTAYATQELFTLFHTLARQQSLSQCLLGFKKQYSLEIVANKEEGIRYILSVPDSDSYTVQKSLLSYLPGLKIKEVSDYLPSDLLVKEKKQRSWKAINKTDVIELKLANDFVLPLKENKLLAEHDPIAYITGNMTKLEKDELIVFQIMASPVTRSSHRSIVCHIEKIQKLISGNLPLGTELNQTPISRALSFVSTVAMGILKIVSSIVLFFADLITTFTDDLNHIENRQTHKLVEKAVVNKQAMSSPYEQELQVAIKDKLSQTLFETSLRLMVKSEQKTESGLRNSGFLASLSSLSSPYQSLVRKDKNLFSLFHSSLKNFTNRQISNSNNPVLSVSELADLYHFPYMNTTKTEDMVKAKSQPLPAPLSFKQTKTHFDNVFAKNHYGGVETLIGQTLEERRRHTYILGATGSGKTTLLSDMIYQDILNGKGVAVLDPHGQLVEKLLEVIPKNRIKDVVWFAPDDDGYPIALNLLELPDTQNKQITASQLQKQKSLVASSLISIMKKFYEAKFFGPRMEYVLRNAVLTVLETPEPTLVTILDLLTKTRYRKSVVAQLNNKVLQDYWVYDFEKLGSLQRNSVVSPITNKIGGILSSPINYQILSQPKSKLDFEEIINSGKILLCDLSKGKIGEDESSFFGSLIIAKIQLAALSRARIPEEDRNDFFLYVDEFQNFATDTFAELVSEARKYRLSTILAHQSISQIENRDIVKVILANVGTTICFKTANPEDEQFILPIFSPEVAKHEISNLPLYNFYMKVAVGQAEDTFLAEADNFTIEGSEKTAQVVIDQSRQSYANPINNPVSNPIEDMEDEANETDNEVEMRQLTATKVSHLDKSAETENDQFQAQKSENFMTYPIQERRKAGIGNKVNITKQHVSQLNSTPATLISSSQQQIILLLARFRFLDRTQIQQLLNHKNHKRILLWLNDLIDKKFIATVDKTLIPTSRAKIYCLTKNSIEFLVAGDGQDKKDLQKFYTESKRSATFVNQSCLVVDIYLGLKKLATAQKSYTMFVRSDYSNHPTNDLLTELSPSAYIEQKSLTETKSYFVEILTNLPEARLRQRLKKYLYFYQDSEWTEATSQPFPTVVMICPTEQIFTYIQRYLKAKLRQFDESTFVIQLAVMEKVNKLGITGDVWTKTTTKKGVINEK